ncbi:MAG TPA: MerR family transcriptional regulator [Gallionellaceae bacterium]|jgi:DNA-binding transcriptional MerR regulator|nr:MerR family transcriptional regulator [Gallionellaceae bacterium]HQS76250.1 MerR family transcriptional regulator [Gallionellaceae bacterium]
MAISISISAAERDTGLSKDALRVWERRYGFPAPMRDSLGERAYSLEQVEKLRVLKRLLDQGHRPGKIIHYSVQELQQLAQESVPAIKMAAESGAENAELQGFVDLCKAHQAETLRHNLAQSLSRMGLERFIVELMAPLNQLVGEAWANGTLQIFEEHLYTESVQAVLRTAISMLQRPHAAESIRPRILLTTLPQEQHGLGLLMAEAIFVLEGANCISLGVQTPIMEIVNAANAQRADIVALSFSQAMNPRQVLQGLEDLRKKLPVTTEIWAGGHSPVLARRPPQSVYVLPNLADIHTRLSEWHARDQK